MSVVKVNRSRICNKTVDQFLLGDGPTIDSQQKYQADGFSSKKSG